MLSVHIKNGVSETPDAAKAVFAELSNVSPSLSGELVPVVSGMSPEGQQRAIVHITPSGGRKNLTHPTPIGFRYDYSQLIFVSLLTPIRIGRSSTGGIVESFRWQEEPDASGDDR